LPPNAGSKVADGQFGTSEKGAFTLSIRTGVLAIRYGNYLLSRCIFSIIQKIVITTFILYYKVLLQPSALVLIIGNQMEPELHEAPYFFKI
jgi:hypothetical protein